ncbi:MAG: ClbS/DfsB family four-helix bundle protein [Cellulomonadaceae bacterium]|jgi:hypothetical protein|nr:ClbS/DfsB family four-helix bundle protein [Cellulomonadaceae bacterium]
MPRATNKEDLLTAAAGRWDALWGLLDAIPGGAEAVAFDFSGNPKLKEAHWLRDKNVRDVFAHLYEWQRLLIDWVAANRGDGSVTPFLPQPYTWKTYGDMNVKFWRKHHSTTYAEAESLLRGSHAQVLALIDSFSDEDLFEKKHFPWTGTSNVASYCISVAPSHYDWAIKKVKQYLNQTHQ